MGPDRRPTRILVASFYPAFYPPRSGGEQRCYYLYHYLSRYFDVTLLAPTYSHHPPEVVSHSPTFREHRVPKDHVFDRLHWQLDAEGIGPECSAYVVALAGGADTALGRRFQELVVHHDVVIHEHPFLLPYDRTLGEDGKPRVYDAHNVESHLFAQMLRGEAGRKAVEFTRFLEQSLTSAARLVLATSLEERDVFIREFGVAPDRIHVAPNGFEPVAPLAGDAVAPPNAGRPYAVFMGSAHPPNVEAALFVVEQVAPALPDVEFRIMGAVCDRLPTSLPPNVALLGFVSDVDKHRQLAHCCAALNPLFSGAGTNLKMLDYMAAGAPIVSTPLGARGLALTDGVDAFVSDSPAYVQTLRRVVTSPERARDVGAAAKAKAFAEYTWSQIADGIRDALDGMLAAPRPSGGRPARPFILALNDFPVAEATYGGQVRIRELLTEVAREFDVVLLCLTAEGRSERTIAPGFTEIRIPKTAAHRQAEARARDGSDVWVDDLVAADFCTDNAELMAALRGLVVRAAAVVFEHPYLGPLLEILPVGIPVVYSSHNVESDLKAATLQNRHDAAERLARVVELEARLVARADLIVCVSEEDRSRFRQMRPDGRYDVIVNGARIRADDSVPSNGDAAPADLLAGRPLAVFLGSAHAPNVAAARFLVGSVAPAVPELTFGIIGTVCAPLPPEPCTSNVLRLGVLTEAEKAVLLSHATVAVNPLFAGGGSSLKVPDFLAAGLALVSTRLGVRGYPLQDGEHYLAAERDDFAHLLRRLVRDGELRRRLGANGHAYCVAELDWRVLGARYRRALRALTAPGARTRALVVTYRFGDPPPGGAEAYLVNVLRELASRDRLAVDVATCDVATTTNAWYFSARYDPPAIPAKDPPYVGTLHRFPVDPPQVEDLAHCRRLFAVWMAEERQQAPTLLAHYDRPLLLGGWNYPEIYGALRSRWMSREGQVFCGRATTAIRILGVPPQPARIDVYRGERPVGSRTVSERFEWTIALSGEEPVVSVRVTPGYVAHDDPRELGIRVLEVATCERGTWTRLDLEDDFAATMRRHAPERWVRSLMEIAERRDAADDALFVRVRGPRSSALRRWLEDNVASYDVVLAQGVPFATPVLVTDVASRQGVPVVILPHFHMEDRYYHWRQYFDVFRRARCVIASSRQVKSLVLDALGAANVALPGGGVDLCEFDRDGLDARQRAFCAVHASADPFVLVLGRKAASKNYRSVIDAVAALNRDGHRVDLVLIGPDDDGEPIDAAHTFYYGSQPRDVVLGALSLAVCLVNMSESESFGIVLLEAWLSGRPVVAQRRCLAFTDLVVPGENGVLVESVEGVARAVAAYLGDPGLAARHAAAGNVLAGGYSWGRLAEHIERVLLDAAPSTAAAADARDCHA